MQSCSLGVGRTGVCGHQQSVEVSAPLPACEPRAASASSQHFVCAKCEKPFLGHRHYEKKGLAYCETHYNQVGPVAEGGCAGAACPVGGLQGACGKAAEWAWGRCRCGGAEGSLLRSLCGAKVPSAGS